jgi:hypothetical protein
MQLRGLVEIASNIHHNIFGLNVRHNSPQPSIFVRTLSPITTCPFDLSISFQPAWVEISRPFHHEFTPVTYREWLLERLLKRPMGELLTFRGSVLTLGPKTCSRFALFGLELRRLLPAAKYQVFPISSVLVCFSHASSLPDFSELGRSQYTCFLYAEPFVKR